MMDDESIAVLLMMYSQFAGKFETSYLITFFFLAFRLFLESSEFNGRIGADMTLRLAWNCARRALTDSRPLAEVSELFVLLEEFPFVDELPGDLLLNYEKHEKQKSLRWTSLFENSIYIKSFTS